MRAAHAFSYPGPAKEGLAAARRTLTRWGLAPERIALRERELAELTRELNALLQPSVCDPSNLPSPNVSDPVLTRVLRREELTESLRGRLNELDAQLTGEYAFCHEVERALETLPPREERLLRLFYRDRFCMDEIAGVLLLSRTQLFRIRRDAELALAPILPAAA